MKQYTSFTNIPNEVLVKIASALLDGQDHVREATETSGRCNLARFSRLDKHIYEIATKILYDTIDVSTLVARPLLETVLQNEKLAALIKHITLTFSYYETECDDGVENKKRPLTTVQKTLFAKVLQYALAELRFDGGDPSCFFEGESPATEAALLLYALPNLVSLQFGKNNTETFNVIYRNGQDISNVIFRRCIGSSIGGIFSKKPKAVPALLSLESLIFTPSIFRNGGEDGGGWNIECLAPFFFCPKIRSIELCGARSTYPWVTNSSGTRLEGFPPSFSGEIMQLAPRSDIKQTDSDGEEDGLNGQCHRCHKTEKELHVPLKRCTKCKKRAYCSKDCQAGDWLSHKRVCKKEKMHHRFPNEVDIDNPGSSTLEVLSLREVDLHAKVLRKILSQPRALKSFTYLKQPFSDYDQGSHLPMKPKLFQLALEAQQNSLETLEIKLNLINPKSLITLHHFKSLRTLKVEVILLVWRPFISLKVALCDTLPTSLRNLTLNFCSWCIKTPLRRYPDKVDVQKNTFEALRFHLRGIAQRSQPLKKLCILLPRLVLCKDEGIPEEWKATKSMAEELFKPTGTELVVKFSFTRFPL